MARGFEETWGSERNSSRSMVPELSWKQKYSAKMTSKAKVSTELVYLVQLHKSFPQPIYFLPVDFFRKLESVVWKE